MRAMGDVEALMPQYKSNTEREFAALGPILLAEHFESKMIVLLYEPCRWTIPGGHYTPDFQAVMDDGQVVFIEVKGSRKQKNYRDARSKLRAAAVIYPMFTWIEVVEEDGWSMEVLNG